jgi:hypothetical protein
MSTFSKMTTYVAKRLIDPDHTTISTDDIKDAINDSIGYWKYRRFWFNEVSDTATLIAQNASFPYPTNFLMPALQDDGFCIEYSGVRYPLSKSNIQFYDGIYLANGYGLPRWYARIGTSLEYQCYPLPDRAYTVLRHYLKDYVALSDDGDTNDFTTNASRLINLWAIGNLISELRQDEQKGAMYMQRANDESKNLLLRTNKMNATGKITIHTTLTG